MPWWLNLALRAAVTAAFMAYLLFSVPWQDRYDDAGKFRQGMINTILGADWRWFAAGLAIGLCVQVIAGIRWAALARPLGFDFSRRFFVWRFFEGSCFSLFLPSSIGGDVVKAIRVGDTTSRRVLAGCSLVADRLTGVSALGVICLSANLATWRGLGVPATLAVAAGILAAAMAAFWIGVGSLDRLLGLMPLPASAREFFGQLLPYQRRPSLMVKAVAWSILVQMGGAIAVAMLGRAVGVERPASVWFSVVPLVSLFIVVPITIGGFGLREASMEGLLQQYGVPHEQGVAIGLLWSATTVLGGLIGLVLYLLDRKPAVQATAAVTAD